MRARRFALADLQIDGQDIVMRYGDLVVVVHDGSSTIDWECVVMPIERAPLEQGAYHLELVTDEGRRLDGDAVLVRSVSGTHVLRGAGELIGFDWAELDET